MPFKSEAQRKFAFAKPEKFGGKKVVKEFAKASKGMKLPEKVRRATNQGKRGGPGSRVGKTKRR